VVAAEMGPDLGPAEYRVPDWYAKLLAKPVKGMVLLDGPVASGPDEARALKAPTKGLSPIDPTSFYGAGGRIYRAVKDGRDVWLVAQLVPTFLRNGTPGPRTRTARSVSH
jgi:hypothetical protein